MTLLNNLGLDDDFIWKDLGYCIVPKTLPSKEIKKRANNWFDNYEDNVVIAEQVDQVCLSCPVIKECLRDGIANKEIGVWGGIYLNNGKIDKQRDNAHKTPAVWKELEKAHGRKFTR